MPQDYDKSNMNRMIREMIPAFKDKRYIKVDGKPMLLVYRPGIIPDVQNTVKEWRKIVIENGFSGLHLVMMQNFDFRSPLEFGMDAATEFAATRGVWAKYETATVEYDVKLLEDLNPVRYNSVRSFLRSLNNPDFVRYKCVCPGWDNSPRRGSSGRFIIDSSPASFFEFCYEACVQTLTDKRLRKDGFVFINAWNEWGEGAHLEPDEKYGYANLEAVKQCVSRLSPD